MANRTKLSLEEVLEGVLDSNEEISDSDLESEWSDNELDPCEKTSTSN